MNNTKNFPNNSMIDINDVVILLIDHQSGLLQTVRDLEPDELRGNIVALAKLAKLMKIPVITTASVPDGPNGPLIPEISQILPDAIYVPRKGQINAWDNEKFVAAVKKIGRKTLIMAGTLSNICLAFPAISAVNDGFKVYALMDASGCWSKFSKDIVLARMTHAGVIPTDVLALIAEIQQTWARAEAQEFAELYADRMPAYRLLMESFDRSNKVAKSGEQDPKDTTYVRKL
jgi:nicotinamidase-related amidase